MTSLFDNLDLDEIFAPSGRRTNQLAAERMASDLLPVCPNCGELCHPSATRCDECCTHLFKRIGWGTQSQAREGADVGSSVALTQPRPVFTCPNCLLDWPDGWCSGCGRHLGKAA